VTRDLVVQFLAQGAQMTFVLLIAPLAVGVVRRVKARLMRRQGPPLLQAYLDLAKLLRKESVIAESASWLFRSAPYLIFALTWVAAALVPTFASGLMFNWAADVVALVALLGAARALLALAGMDVGTSFGGIGSSREMMIATLAEPAMMLIVLTLAIAAGTTRLAGVADFFIAEPFGVRVSLALSLIALVIVALAENARIPVDNPATHLELTMVHEAMILEYSGRHLAMIEFGAFLPVLVETIQVIRQPGGADFQERQAELGKTHRHALADHAGELEQDAGGKSVGMHLGESVQPLGAELARPTAGAVDAENRAAPFRGFIDGIIK
jgi:formate hydrogenlyase subunit 4